MNYATFSLVYAEALGYECTLPISTKSAGLMYTKVERVPRLLCILLRLKMVKSLTQ